MIQNIFKKAWQITKKNKFLWFLGVLIASFGQENMVSIFFNKKSFFSATNKLISLKEYFYNNNFILSVRDFNNSFANHPSLIIFFIFIALLFVFAVIFINVIAQGALIHCSYKLGLNKKTSLKEGIKAGIHNFWQLFYVFILGKLFIIISCFVFIIPFFIAFIITDSYRWLFFSLLFLILTIIPLVFIIYFIIPLSFCYIILNKNRALEAIKKSIGLFFKNFFINLKFAAGLLLIFILTLILLSITSYLFTFPILLLSLIFNSFSLTIISWTIIILSSIIISVIVLIFFGVFTAFQYNSWVCLFSELTSDKTLNKMVLNN